MNSPKKRDSLVRRITIDERLDDSLIRILVADLKANLKTFGDDPEYWEEEKEFLVRPKDYQGEDYQEAMGMTQANVKKWPWESLYEGQVFLEGRFRGSRNRHAKGTFVVSVKRRNFQCIDRVSRERVKKNYLAALEGGS
ncbi:MAG: hypothetical protein GH159_05335 [Dehalococcoidia bacterium]|nr:hypothetical protein [Dehalococcoidia bacterium]